MPRLNEPYVVVSSAGQVALFPLLFTPHGVWERNLPHKQTNGAYARGWGGTEALLKVLLLLAHLALVAWHRRQLTPCVPARPAHIHTHTETHTRDLLP
jgi:hypothetical protein